MEGQYTYQMSQAPEETLSRSTIASEDASYHSIRIYNLIRDKLWERLELANNSPDTRELGMHIQELRLLLLRGDKVWREISKAVEEKKRTLKVDTIVFPYTEQLKKLALKLDVIYELLTKTEKLIADGDNEALEYLQMQPEDGLQYIKKRVEDIITDADEVWGEHAALIDFTMPIEVKDSRDPFL